MIEDIEALHLFDGEQRLLMVDQIIHTNNTSLGVRDLYRSTLNNHLGSFTMELDEQAQLISYEEYHPYGTSAFRAGRNEAKENLKRYRYTGMERDEESGPAYHSSRGLMFSDKSVFYFFFSFSRIICNSFLTRQID